MSECPLNDERRSDMSGVIDEKGQQWEHCNNCGDFVKIQNLRYEQPTEKYDYGRDLCSKCYELTKE